MKKTFRSAVAFIAFFIFYVSSVIYSVTPSTITMIKGKELTYPFYDFIEINFKDNTNIQAVNGNLVSSLIGKEKAVLSLFGKIPLKYVDVNVVSDTVLVGGGDAIGMKLTTPGLTIVTFEEFKTRDYSTAKPYKNKDIQRGDTIVKVNDTDITDVNQFIYEIQKCNGNDVTLTYLRNGRLCTEVFTPQIDRNDGQYKLGMWVKNVTSGVGTVTYIDKISGTFGALGHGISDMENMGLLDINGGTAYKAVILSVKKGTRGSPGELKGAIRESDVYGEVIKNTRFGVFGNIDNVNSVDGDEYEICLKNEVKEGPAKILSTVNGEKTKSYDIEIEQVNLHGDIQEKSMIIKIIDPDLLSKTGGIVQGMSGSPIIQNGKLIGAVTHVLINDPTRGYGIFIETMLEEAS